MFDARNEILKVWERILETTSEMLEVAKRRNILLKESEEQEKEFRKKEDHYQNFAKILQDFNEKEADKNISSLTKLLNCAIATKLDKAKEDASLYLSKYKEAAKLTNELEEYKKYLNSFMKIYRTIHLQKEEIPSKKLYELVILILLANEEDSAMDETEFFVSKEEFYKMLDTSGDSNLQGLLSGSNITNQISLDSFLELL